MIKVAILLSYYDGIKYIDEQLLSISRLNIDGISFDVIIRNDGCNNSESKSYLCSLSDKYSFVKITTGNNIGVVQSFYKLLDENSGYDFYAFCDQDDYWCEDKIKVAIDLLSRHAGPVLYCSDYTAVDHNLNELIVKNREVVPTIYNGLFKNFCTGCTCIINDSLRSKLLAKWPRQNIPMHDWWMLLSAYCVGNVVFDHRSFILYRQHSNNVVGVLNNTLLKKIRRYCKNIISNNKVRSEMVKLLLVSYKENMSPDIYDFLSLCIKENKTLKDVLSIVFSNKFTYHSIVDRLAVKFIIIVNRF